jgi:tetratricopeptide (TPR) repeat protein
MDPSYSSQCIGFSSDKAFVGTPFGLTIFDKENNKWETWDFDIFNGKVSNATSPNFDGHILATLVDSPYVWVSAWERKGVYRIDLRDLTFEIWVNQGINNSYGYESKPAFVKNCPFPSNTIVSIRKDRTGNIWFGTIFGVAKFDGKEWSVFKSASWGESLIHIQQSVIDATITSLDIDKKGRVWVGTSNFFYAYYEPGGPPEEDVSGGIGFYESGKWFQYYANNYNLKNPSSLRTKTPLLSNDVLCLVIDDNEVWIGTGCGLSLYNMKTKKWRDFTREKDSLISNRINSIAISPKSVWITADGGFVRYDKGEKYWENFLIPDTILNPYIISIGFDNYTNDIWMVTSRVGYQDVYVYRFKNGHWTAYSTLDRLSLQSDTAKMRLGLLWKKTDNYREAQKILSEIIETSHNPDLAMNAEYELLTMYEYGIRRRRQIHTPQISGKDQIKLILAFQKKYSSAILSKKLQFTLAQAYEEVNEWEKAITAYQTYLKLIDDKNKTASVKLAIGNCYEKIGRYDEQATILKELIQKHSGTETQISDWYWLLADLYKHKLKNYRLAIEYYQIINEECQEILKTEIKGEKINHKISEISFQIGECYEALGELEKALEAYETVKVGRDLEAAKNRIQKIQVLLQK